MDLATAPLFDLAAAGDTVVDGSPAPVVPTRSEELLDELAVNRAEIVDRQIGELRRIAEWAAVNTVELPEDASTLTERGLDTGLPLAGEGAPLISDFAVMALGARLDRSLDGIRRYVGQVVELAWRLPDLWARVLGGDVQTWKALRVAELTRPLSAEAAGFVDRNLARYAPACTWAQIERLVDEAIARFDPALAEQRRHDASDHRHCDIHLDQAGIDGTVPIDASLDLADALDLEHALREGAKRLGEIGCEDSLDVRRSIALGDLARSQQVLDLDTGEITTTQESRTVELFVHLTDAALAGTAAPGSAAGGCSVGRVGNTRTPITMEQIRDWCASAGKILVRPVIDVTGHEPVDAYEIPDRLRRQVQLRDHHCVFPGCTRPVETCDLDHVEPYHTGGSTCPHNLAPLCRGHHRLKTAGRFTYRVLAPAVYEWTETATGHTWTVTPRGTTHTGPPDR